MKHWSTSRLSAKSKSLFFIVAVGLTVAGTVPIACKSNPATAAASTSRQAEARRSSTLRAANPRNQPPQCPTFGPILPPTPTPPQGSHTVLLSWKASAPVDSKHPAAVGYCVYRGTDPKNPPIELLNPVPFSAGIKCTDNSVQNGNQYYYVVRAVSAGNAYSDPSKPAPASVPIILGSNSSGYSAPLCRQP